jgi:hypothetical protein
VAARRVASTASLPLTSRRPPLLQAGRTAIAVGKHEHRVLDQGRAPRSRAYKTDSHRPCLTPKPHRPSSLPAEPPTATARAVSVADCPPPSISLHSPSPT